MKLYISQEILDISCQAGYPDVLEVDKTDRKTAITGKMDFFRIKKYDGKKPRLSNSIKKGGNYGISFRNVGRT